LNYNCTHLSKPNLPTSFPSKPNNQCLSVSASDNGVTEEYTCNNNSIPYHTTSWISITAYNDASCAAGSSGWVSYACGSCMPLGNGAFYKLTCTQTTSSIDYRFANYTASNCASSSLIYSDQSSVSSLRAAGSCIARVVGSNLAEAADLNTGFYSYAKYSVITGSTPPSPPYSGYFKV
jgi:hypothetical protein